MGAVAPMLLVIITHLFVASSRQRFYDRLRCEEESGKSTLIDLINQVQDIKNYFTTSYQTVVSYPDRPPKQKQYQTIRANKEYALWRARIEAELGTLTQDRSENPNGSYRAVKMFVRIFPSKSSVSFIVVYRSLNKSALIPIPKRLPIPAAMISNVVFIAFPPHLLSLLNTFFSPCHFNP